MAALLFDDLARDDRGPKAATESSFSYLNRSARKPFARIREILQGWFDDYPAHAQREWRARFRSKQDRQHFAAFFELYCHELLRKDGFQVEVHPGGGLDKRNSPDFLVRRHGQPVFYLEAVLVTGSETEHAAEARLAQIVDTIGHLQLPDFDVLISIARPGSRSASTTKIRRFITEKARSLNPDEIILSGMLPRFRYEEADWSLSFGFIPKPPQLRGMPGRGSLGAICYEARWIRTREYIAKRLREKSSKYGNLRSPFVIAVNCIHFAVGDEDVFEALFGRETIRIRLPDERAWREREPDGVWWGPRGYQFRHVSAVLAFQQLLPWSTASVTPTLWHHPHASRPLEPGLWRLPQRVPNRETHQMDLIDGLVAREILGVEADLLKNDPRKP